MKCSRIFTRDRFVCVTSVQLSLKSEMLCQWTDEETCDRSLWIRQKQTHHLPGAGLPLQTGMIVIIGRCRRRGHWDRNIRSGHSFSLPPLPWVKRNACVCIFEFTTCTSSVSVVVLFCSVSPFSYSRSCDSMCT